MPAGTIGVRLLFTDQACRLPDVKQKPSALLQKKRLPFLDSLLINIDSLMLQIA